MGGVVGSEQKELYNLEGFNVGPELLLYLGAAGFVSKDVAIGGYVAYAETLTSAPGNGPKLSRRSVAMAGQVPWFLGGTADTRFLFTPRAGVLLGWASFTGSPSSQVAPYLGASIEMLFIQRAFGLGMWGNYAPAPKPGESGQSDNYGNIGLHLGGIIDG